ncbi:hypothetical protein [Mycobacterium timonense]|uniref:Transmembrane protein n=1 Tax=Mycobacterium timonense TaxID=701043 RepID=A0A7I9ZEY0_9MYCO|nr:hypothetical protein [Mycobacterium timonense]GFG99177.1 hypothetical protein MTIM_50560 [Mycobacterium timonense]
MGRKVAIPWHASFTIAAGFLYFFFVLPRWPELMGDTAHSLGTALRIVTGALVALAALPVVFTLLRTRKPELGTPQLALSIRVASIVAHVLAGVLIIGTAISEIWLSLDVAGRWLFGIYGAAAAIALLGFFAFYLSFVAELPPPPPKPIKAKKPKKTKKRGLRRKKGEEADAEAAADEAAEAEEADETVEAEASEPDETDAVAEEVADGPAETEAAPVTDTADATEESEEPRAKLQNRRPTGKGSHRMRRRSTAAGTAVDDTVNED